jgi:signal transduction histidine kinase
MLVERLQKVFGSDGCYITFWDDEQGKTLPFTAIGPMSEHYNNLEIIPGEATLTKSVLDAGNALAIDDISQSEYISARIAEKFPDRSVLALPLIAGDQRLGAVIISFIEHHTFTSEEIRLGESIARQTALAISKAELLELEQRRRREAEVLRDGITTLTSTLDIDQVLTRILEQLSKVVYYDSASVFLIEGDMNRIVAARGFKEPKRIIDLNLELSNTFFREIREKRAAIIVEDVLEEPSWVHIEDLETIRGWMGIPLIAQEEVIGFLTIDNHQPGAYKPADAELAQAFANQAAIALYNAQLYAATRRRLAESNALFYISNLIVASPEQDVETILYQVVDLLWREFGYYHAHVYLIAESGALIANQGSGPIGAELKEKGYQFAPDEGIVGYAATIGEAFMTNDVADVHFFMDHPLLSETSAELAAPLKAREQILGVLDIQHRPPNTFDDADFRFLTAVADQLAMVLDKAQIYNELQAALVKEQRTRDQLVQAEKLAAMGRLIASVAHELNNPLQAIQNALYLVKMEDSLTDQAKEDLQVAINEGARMAGLIARLRDTYRPTTAADYQSESLNTLVEEVQKLIGTHLRHNNVSLEFIPQADLPKTTVIRDQIKQVILNLCINGIESMPDGGQLTICSTLHPDLEQIHLSVRDTGPGLTPEIQSKIFEPFFTTKEGGTGLGLAVSYEIAQNHGGSIEAQNKPKGNGAIFTLTLPYKLP